MMRSTLHTSVIFIRMPPFLSCQCEQIYFSLKLKKKKKWMKERRKVLMSKHFSAFLQQRRTLFMSSLEADCAIAQSSSA